MNPSIIQPTYITKLPSNGTQVKYRPFTVAEEKALLLALQEASAPTITEAIKNVISVCTFNKVDPDSIPYYDTEYLYLQIRAKSIGEEIELNGYCECSEDAKTPFTVDITDAIIEPKPTGNFRVKIPDTKYTLDVRHPSLEDFTKRFDQTDNSASVIVSNCIVQVFTDEEVMDWSNEEKLSFVESMTSKQQKDIAKFLKEMPICKIPVKYTCKSCGKVHNDPLVGFQNFFL
jgi:hypothetical protein